jgi:hypothetical protein
MPSPDSDTIKNVYDFLQPAVTFVYNEVYIYLWILCFYHIFFMCLVVAILILLIQLLNNTKR